MARRWVGSFAGVALVTLWIVAAMLLGDYAREWPRWAQILYYAAAGTLWVVPAWRIMIWSVRP